MSTRTIPQWMEKEIQKIGGLATDGRPRFRLVWGSDRYMLNNEKELVHAYQIDRWHMERLYQGDYEHIWKFHDCPHKTPTKQDWCKNCYLEGGVFVDATESFALVEKIIHLFQKSDDMQNKCLQKNALMEREESKERKQAERLKEAVDDKKPLRVKRSYEPKMAVEAPFGSSKMKQIIPEEKK